jgi:hypothetical protein
MNALDQLLKAAEQAAQEAESWADLSNALFNPIDGLVSRAYRTREAREAFVKTEAYRKIWQLVSDAMDRFGLVEGAIPKKSGRFVVRLPQSLHGALEREAIAEGVSLNQLVVSKLSLTLGRLSHLVCDQAETGSAGQQT